jgi:predicted DNA-binding transcriptional regulator AlpA
MTLETLAAGGRRYLQYKDLESLGILNSRATLSRWLKAGNFPKPIYPEPSSPRWLIEELLAWEKSLMKVRQAA